MSAEHVDGKAGNLEDIIIYSVGIGASFEEAAKALQEAKKGDKLSLANAAVYRGEPVPETDSVLSSNAENYLKVSRFLEKNNADVDTLNAHALLGMDSKTGLINGLGYSVARELLRARGVNQGYFILLDGNDMHGHNEAKGYSNVDDYLTATGQAIVESTRSGLERRDDERKAPGRRKSDVQEDIIAHRVHDSAGDEFLVYIPAQHSPENLEIVKGIANRMLNRIYELEMEVAQRHIEAGKSYTLVT